MLSLSGHLSKRVYTKAWISSSGSEACSRCLSVVAANKYPAYQNKRPSVQSYNQARWYADGPKKQGFFSGLVEDIKKGFSKDTNIQDNIKKFRDEAKKIEHSETLKAARAKFEKIEKEGKASVKLNETFSNLKETVEKSTEGLAKSDYVKKGKEYAETIKKTTGETAEKIGQSKGFQTVTKGVKEVTKDLHEFAPKSNVYITPKNLLKRTDLKAVKTEEKEIEADTETMGMVMHKDSVWQQQWTNLKENNPLFKKFGTFRHNISESEELHARTMRTMGDSISTAYERVSRFMHRITTAELSKVYTEIHRMDPTFSRDRFLRDCREMIIPNILEAEARGELEVLESWCFEAEYNRLSMAHKQCKERHLTMHKEILDLGNIEILDGNINDSRPVLYINFTSQQLVFVKDATGKVVEGKEDTVYKFNHVWALCRDPAELDPRAAWRLIESHADGQEVLF